METNRKTQAKFEILYRFWNNPQSTREKDSNHIQFQPSQNLDAVIAFNQQNGLRQKLAAYKVFTDSNRNKDLYDVITDSEGVPLTSLLNGYNTALITYGLRGRGKTHSLFGSDSIYNETRIDFNVLTRVYSEMKKQMPGLNISLSVIEVAYDEEQKSENIIDLLDVSNPQEDYGVSLDFSNYTNVAIRSQHELEKVLRVGLRRSSNWAEKKELEKSMIVQPKVEYHNNASHMICKLSFVNPTQKSQFAFYLADLIGFDNEQKEDLSQISLNHLNKFIDELSSQKDLQSYRQSKLQTIQSEVNKGGSYNVFSSQHMRIVNFLAQITLTSQTFFFLPFYSEGESYKFAYPLLERCFKLTTLRYVIDKEQFDSSKKANFVLYQNYAKQAELSVNESVIMGLKTPPSGSGMSSAKKQEAGANPFLVEGLSPIGQALRSNREGIYIQDNSEAETPIKRDASNVGKIKNDVANVMDRIDSLQKKVEEIRKTSPRKERQEGTFSGFSSPTGSHHNFQLSNPLPLRSRQNTDLELMSADTFGRSPQAKISSPKVKVQEILRKERASSAVDARNTVSAANRESYFADYNRKVKDIMGTIEDFMVAEINTLKKDKLPTEYYHLRRNFDILYRVFKEGENVNSALVKDFLDLGLSINQFKQDYDMRLEDAQNHQQQLQNQFSQIIEEKGFRDLFEVYERDIQNLIKDGEALKEHNTRIVNEIQQFNETETRTGIITDYNVLGKKHNHLVKQYGRAVRQLNEREEEITALRKKDRIFMVEKRMGETVQVKIESLSKKVESQEEKNKALIEKLRIFEEQNIALRGKVRDQDEEIKRFSEEYYKTMEKATLYKEMAKSPSEVHVQVYKEARESTRHEKLDKSISAQRIKDLDKVLTKLKSFEY